MSNLDIWNKYKEVPKTALKEVWKDISNYEGYYQVSNLGRIRSVDRQVNSIQGTRIVKSKILKPNLSRKTGYYQIHLYKNNSVYRCSVHTLVAKAFVPNLLNKPCVNHIDGIKTNNNSDNLEWVTTQENQLHALSIGINKNYSENHYKAKQVNQYNINGELIKQWNCINDISRALGILEPNIVKCCKGQRKTTGGFIFRYAN